MRRSQDKWAIGSLTSLAVAAALLMTFSSAAVAQRGGSGSVGNRARDRENGTRVHEAQMRDLTSGKGYESPSDLNQRQMRATIEQVRQDFDRIQVINTEIVRAVKANAGFDYKNISEQAAEIRKRARRLKDNIRLPAPGDEEAGPKIPDELTQTEMKGALLVLSSRIISFVTNPLFETSNWIDVKLGAKASRDLEAIIEQSATIKKSAEKLSKTTR